MAAGATYNCLATTTSSGSSPTIVFSNISQSYTDLVMVISGKSIAGAGYWDVQFNTDTSSGSTNYGFVRLIGFGSTVLSDRYSNFKSWEPSIGEDQGTMIINFQNYSNTTTHKSGLWRGSTSNANRSAELSCGVWKNTAAINTITLTSNNGSTNLPAGTIYTLYGIAAA